MSRGLLERGMSSALLERSRSRVLARFASPFGTANDRASSSRASMLLKSMHIRVFRASSEVRDTAGESSSRYDSQQFSKGGRLSIKRDSSAIQRSCADQSRSTGGDRCSVEEKMEAIIEAKQLNTEMVRKCCALD
eukprot:7366565-Prymnesium_polylepis.4